MSPRRLSLEDQALINLCGWIACQVQRHDHDALVQDLLKSVLPHVTQDNELITPLAEAAQKLLDAAPSRNAPHAHWTVALLNLQAALAPIFFIRASLAIEARWPTAQEFAKDAAE